MEMILHISTICSMIEYRRKALVRERRVPFDMVTREYLADQIILAKLAEAERELADPNTVLLDHDEVFGPIRKQFGYEV